MSRDLTETLRTAAKGPVPALDHSALRRRAAHRTTIERAAAAGGTALAVSAIAAVVLAAQPDSPPTPEVVAPDGPSDGPIVAWSEDVQSAFADCEVLPVEELASREHFDPPSSPPAEELYTAGRPTATGPHYATPGPILDGVAPQQLDERATTHNLEHGSVILWFDPAQLEDAEIAEIRETVATLNGAGFHTQPSRTGIIASPYTDPGIDSGKPIALRAWGQARDCATWNRDALLGFIADHYGTHGTAPEGSLAPYPEAALQVTTSD